jgi:membrane-associated protease RseP (regulator of RpoE activity)
MHELGHYFAAKKVGCKVETVSLGFGKALYKVKIGETTYKISPILLGGYCSLKDESIASLDKDSFTNLRYRDKVILVVAGCAVNIVIGTIFLLLGTYTHFRISPELWFFGYLSMALGITNLIPFPALDGSYPILVGLEKIYGKEKGYKIMNKIVKVGFWIIMTLNVATLGFLVWYYRLNILLYIAGALCFILNLLMKLIALVAISG